MYLLDGIICSCTKGLLSITQRNNGVLSLIPKDSQLPYLLTNWRPISLLNCVYKVFSKTIANRVRRVLPKIINTDQTGFLKGGLISKNIRTNDEMMKITDPLCCFLLTSRKKTSTPFTISLYIYLFLF